MYPVEYDTKVICETEREPDTHNPIRPTSLHGRGTNFKLPVSCMQNFDVSQLPRKQTDFQNILPTVNKTQIHTIEICLQICVREQVCRIKRAVPFLG